MPDIKGISIFLFAWLLKALIFFPALFQGLKISHYKKNVGDYGRSLGVGIDIYGAKLIAPHANKYWVKPGGRLFGIHNETISETMAHNKNAGDNTEDADKWERYINFFEKDHLKKTLKQ